MKRAPGVVEESKTGFIVQLNGARALRGRIRYFLDNPSEAKRMVEDRFTWEDMAKRCLRGLREF